MFYFHCIFIIYLILFYLNDSVSSPRLLCHATVILTFHHCTGSQQSASRGCVLAFYRIAPCLTTEKTVRNVTLKKMYFFASRQFPAGAERRGRDGNLGTSLILRLRSSQVVMSPRWRLRPLPHGVFRLFDNVTVHFKMHWPIRITGTLYFLLFYFHLFLIFAWGNA